MQNLHDASEYKSRWNQTDNVPGRPVSSTHLQLINNSKSASPKKNSLKAKHRKTASACSFQEFQDSTEDAWDIGDDEFYHENVSIHHKVAESTAMKVLNNHSKGQLLFSTPDEKKYSDTTFKDTSSEKMVPKRDDVVPVPSIEKHKSVSSTNSPQKLRSHLTPHYFGPGKAIRQVQETKFSVFSSSNSSSANSTERESARNEQFNKLLQSENVDMRELRKLSWSGIPNALRSFVWKLLADYLPTCLERRDSYLARKKEEYHNLISRYYDHRNEDVHHETYRQIHIDVPRMSPLVPIFQQEIVQMAFERILYILAIRHPASGYVQGMNDLVTPFFVVFLQDYIPSGADVESYDVSLVPSEDLKQVEADSYWCMAKLLDGIQDNYTFAQPGIQKKVQLLKEIVQRIDAPLHAHLKRHSIEYLQFSFRWMNNLLMRELPLACTIRLWDTYLSEINGFSNFHLYVCAAFLKHWSKELLLEKDFQGLMLALQNLPTLHWSDNEISLLVAEAYRLKYTFDDAPNHLQSQEN